MSSTASSLSHSRSLAKSSNTVKAKAAKNKRYNERRRESGEGDESRESKGARSERGGGERRVRSERVPAPLPTNHHHDRLSQILLLRHAGIASVVNVYFLSPSRDSSNFTSRRFLRIPRWIWTTFAPITRNINESRRPSLVTK